MTEPDWHWAFGRCRVWRANALALHLSPDTWRGGAPRPNWWLVLTCEGGGLGLCQARCDRGRARVSVRLDAPVPGTDGVGLARAAYAGGHPAALLDYLIDRAPLAGQRRLAARLAAALSEGAMR